MALTIEEGTKQETLDRIDKAGFKVGYANIMRVFIDCHGNYTAEIRRYDSEETRQEEEMSTPGLIGIGGQISEDIKSVVFAKVYPYIEFDINRTYLMGQMNKEIESIPPLEEGETKDVLENKKKEIIDRYNKEIELLRSNFIL